ncbi:MAG: hypothetical protein AB7S71_05750 [Dongiaceae bacterium]
MTVGTFLEAAMMIDIVQAYAEAMHVALMHRPAPTPIRRMSPQPVREEDAAPTSTASPGIARWIARWLAHHLGRLGGRDDVPSTRPSRLQGCG